MIYKNLFIIILFHIILSPFNDNPILISLKILNYVYLIMYLFQSSEEIVRYFIENYNLITESWNSKYIDKVIHKLEEKYDTLIIVIIDKKYNNSNVLTIDDTVQFTQLIQNNMYDTVSVIIHTDGGSIKASDMIVNILLNSSKKINMYIPYYAFSAGTMIALTGDWIHMTRQSFLGPTDPQISITYDGNTYDVPSRALIKGKFTDDNLNIHKHDATIYHYDNIRMMRKIFRIKGNRNNKKIINLLGSGMYPHTRPITGIELQNLGMTNIIMDIPKDFVNLIDILF